MKKERVAKKKWLSIGAVALLLLSAVTGCGGSFSADNAAVEYDNYGETNNYDYDYGMANDMAQGVADKDYSVDESFSVSTESPAEEISEETGSSSNNDILKGSKKIIKTYNYKYETEKFDEAYEKLMQLIEEHEGYVASSNLSGTNNRFLSMTAKIPADKSDAFANSTGALGTLQSKTENADDVTLEYTDTESRISSLKTEQQRLNELLKDADGLETIIALEDRLSEVRYELENYQSRKNQLDSLITYSTVNISLQEVKYEIEVDEESFMSRVTAGLKTTLRDISDGATDFAVWFIVDFPYFVIWIVIIFIIVKIVKAIIKSRKKRKEKKKEKQQSVQQQNEQKPEVEEKEDK